MGLVAGVRSAADAPSNECAAARRIVAEGAPASLEPPGESKRYDRDLPRSRQQPSRPKARLPLRHCGAYDASALQAFAARCPNQREHVVAVGPQLRVKGLVLVIEVGIPKSQGKRVVD